MKNVILCLSIAFLVAGCKKKDSSPPVDETPTTVSSDLSLCFINTFKGTPLNGTNTYTTDAGDPVTVTKFNYYISNITLIRADQSQYTVPESYFIVKQSAPESRTITISAPVGDYVGVKFLIGVDSARNCSGAQTGGLDLAYASDMYWSWNSGYIFMKLEGASDSAGNTTHNYEYHIGGFGGPNKTQRWCFFNFGANASVQTGHKPIATFITDVNQIFMNPQTIRLKSKYSVVTAGASAKTVADNYADMFTFYMLVN